MDVILILFALQHAHTGSTQNIYSTVRVIKQERNKKNTNKNKVKVQRNKKQNKKQSRNKQTNKEKKKKYKK